MMRTHTRRHRRRDSQPDRVPQLRKHIEHPARQAVVARIRTRHDQTRHREYRVRVDGRQQHGDEGVGPVRRAGAYSRHEDG